MYKRQGHNPLPWPQDDERPCHRCYCGKDGCIETWLSGPGIGANFQDGKTATVDIVSLAASGDAVAESYLQRVEDRLARALATIITVIDPVSYTHLDVYKRQARSRSPSDGM